MLTQRQLKIIARHMEREESKLKTKQGQETFRSNMKLMVEELGGDIHDYEQIIERQERLF